MSILAVFRSRAHSLDFYEQLRRYGIDGTTMPTPKEADIGCGICVRFSYQSLPRAWAILKKNGYSSFKGLYKVHYINGRMIITPFQYKA